MYCCYIPKTTPKNHLVMDPWTSIANIGFQTTCDSTTGGGGQMLTMFSPAFDVAKCPSFPTNVTKCFESDVLCNEKNGTLIHKLIGKVLAVPVWDHND